MRGGIGNDVLEVGTGIDTLDGESGSDALYGNAGGDSLRGGAGDDTVYGNSGSDWLTGGLGDDLLFGGHGADTFEFRGGEDSIGDFSEVVDCLTFVAGLWSSPPIEPDNVLQHANVVDGNVVFDFGAGGTLTLTDVGNIALLVSLIDID